MDWKLTTDEREALKKLTDYLAVDNRGILSCVTREVMKGLPGREQFAADYVVTDPYTGEKLARIPSEVVGKENAGQWIIDQIGGFCALCNKRLLEGEDDGLCVTCESHTVMDLLRLRDQLT